MGFIKNENSTTDLDGHGSADHRVDNVVVGAEYQLSVACISVKTQIMFYMLATAAAGVLLSMHPIKLLDAGQNSGAAL